MNLATRCGACGTLFRVVQDQLKVSDGWVRCGRCHEVFNAVESLVDLDQGVPPELAATSGPPGPAGASQAHDASAAPATALPAAGDPTIVPAPAAGFDAPFDLAIPTNAAQPAAVAPAAEGLSARPDRTRDADADAAGAREPGSLAAGLAPQAEVLLTPVEVPAEDLPVAPLAARPAAEPPWFARPPRPPERRARRRWSMVVLALLLGLLLVAQLLVRYRDLAAARWPELRPVLAAACAPFGCSLGPPRRIEAVAVENTALTLTALPGAYRLSVGLRNRARTAIALPSIELALTDTEGRLLARRVLAPRDFSKVPDSIAAGADVPLQALLATPGERVSGYTIEIFYP